MKPNDYNPNYVAPAEMRLLKISILETGWTQPIVCDKDYVIIDGFHRYTVAGDKEVSNMTEGKVPVVIVDNIDDSHRRLATVRHNRARGTHAVLEMSKVVRYLVESGMDAKEIIHRLGMDDEEVERLATRDGMPARIVNKKQQDFSSAWKPKQE